MMTFGLIGWLHNGWSIFHFVWFVMKEMSNDFNESEAQLISDSIF